ncbi:hypothetical protein SAMN00120144_3692 [Hymenobacter roseosalivarius DSM 11622]|uniref:Uncharacterized protein n=1 Tax=Hymenobacter roseosalivarius DSM 11622 TaxID=645990 RepID=A0A1W1W276_9BACT|nr:hypothetical protein SAMN00120144_3692 [Hymenobacter roseosalivarius DSM 11622]
MRGQDWVYPKLKFTGMLNPNYIHRHWTNCCGWPAPSNPAG